MAAEGSSNVELMNTFYDIFLKVRMLTTKTPLVRHAGSAILFAHKKRHRLLYADIKISMLCKDNDISHGHVVQTVYV